MTGDEQAPIASNVASLRPKAGLAHLPPEVVYEIAKILPGRTDLLRLMKVCKGTLVPAGEMLYHLYTVDRLKRLIVPLDALVEGMQHPSPSPAAPFGSALKATFLRAIHEMVYDVLLPQREGREVAVLQGVPPTTILFVLDRFVVRDRYFQPAPYAIPLALAPHLRTDHFCWFASPDRPFDPPPAGAVGGPDYSHLTEVRFAPGCIPETFTTHGADLDWRILPCYGSLNRVHFATKERLMYMSTEERIDAFVKFFGGLHPELRDPDGLNDEETQRRAQTKWEIYPAGQQWDPVQTPGIRRMRLFNKDAESDMTRELEQGLWTRMPALQGRVRFFSSQGARKCSVCGTLLFC